MRLVREQDLKLLQVSINCGAIYINPWPITSDGNTRWLQMHSVWDDTDEEFEALMEELRQKGKGNDNVRS